MSLSVETGRGSEKDLEILGPDRCSTQGWHPGYPEQTRMRQDRVFWNLGFLSEFSLKVIHSVTVSGVTSAFL